ncbi:MAG: hypothetical protein P1Q69_17675, partial [Candidatus Thorarchaeota archaeon]|nr:hypothetical protein [Candidatus Thorarchaeota archaeon]
VAQTSLIANERLDNQLLMGREDDYYQAGFYQVSLNPGHWTIVVETFFDQEVKITVASNSNMSAIIAESGTGWGNYPEVDFALASTETVYILVEENSPYGDSTAIYNIGVYDDAHLATYMASTLTFTTSITDNPFDLSSFFAAFMYIFIAILILVPILCVICISRRAKSQLESLQVIKAPQVAIPQKYQSRTEVDDGLRMVRIPVKCPECNAPLSPESIDWVGPLEAKCNYCGSTVRAKFERI